MREHERIRNRMRVCDERRERTAASGHSVEGGSSWNDTEDEGPHFKIKGRIKALPDVSPLHTQTHRFSFSLSEKESVR